MMMKMRTHNFIQAISDAFIVDGLNYRDLNLFTKYGLLKKINENIPIIFSFWLHSYL